MTAWFAFVFAMISGAFVTIQAGSNAALKKAFTAPLPALVVNYALGVAAVLAYAAITQTIPWPSADKAAGAPWWAWIGGLAGAVYGVAAILLAHQLGAATLMAAAVTGQVVCSVLLDHFGWIGFETHPASPWRVVGCLLMIAGFA